MKELREILEKNDINEARAILHNEILWNNSDEEVFYKMISLCEDFNIFDENDGNLQEKDINEYTENDLIDLNTSLTLNFSKERCLLAYKVSRYIKGEKTENKDFLKEEKVIYTTNESDEFKNKDTIKKILIVGGIILGTKMVFSISKRKKKLNRVKKLNKSKK